MSTEQEAINVFRQDIKDTTKHVKGLKERFQARETDGEEDIGEMIANAMLAYRHLEDASMRLGKVLQAKNGGVSIYDHNVVGDTTENEDK